ncbi:hypothetical protein E0H86_05950 [Acinetobacter sp. ANC 4635]|uniref:hypothetical protein n=1 Tax=Acinetobacter sp. ANC 4635 TaxID=2529846 RepID=UPI00103BF8D2|nr:hypothetical protein [Acinetobacter sp. ANC 4635]TCB31962.1 hypothetical protein E0H86_05950 [Acinetobacter sp. ANC 4635]
MELKIDKLTREELEDYCKVLQVEYSELDSENQVLGRAILDVVELARQDREMAENYQTMFSHLFDLIKTQYDSEFKIEDFTKVFS